MTLTPPGHELTYDERLHAYVTQLSRQTREMRDNISQRCDLLLQTVNFGMMYLLHYVLCRVMTAPAFSSYISLMVDLTEILSQEDLDPSLSRLIFLRTLLASCE